MNGEPNIFDCLLEQLELKEDDKDLTVEEKLEIVFHNVGSIQSRLEDIEKDIEKIKGF